MLLLKAVEENWGLMGPGSWEKKSWKINSDGTYQRKTTYRPVDPEDAEESVVTEEGALYEEQMDALRECIEEYWSNEKSDACDGTAWEFKLYDQYGSVICHREMGYIYGIEPYESIAALLHDEDDSEENDWTSLIR